MSKARIPQHQQLLRRKTCTSFRPMSHSTAKTDNLTRYCSWNSNCVSKIKPSITKGSQNLKTESPTSESIYMTRRKAFPPLQLDLKNIKTGTKNPSQKKFKTLKDLKRSPTKFSPKLWPKKTCSKPSFTKLFLMPKDLKFSYRP